MKALHTLIFLLVVLSMFSMTISDIRFCLDHELMDTIKSHESDVHDLIATEPLLKDDFGTILEYAQRTDNLELATVCHYQLATLYGTIEDALQWIDLSDYTVEDSLSYAQTIGILKSVFADPADSLILNSYLTDRKSMDYLYEIPKLAKYNDVIEAIAKGIIDDLSVEVRDSLALNMVEGFYATFPNSRWKQAALYYQLYHLSNQRDYPRMWDIIDGYRSSMNKTDPLTENKIDASQAIVCAIYLTSPSFRKNISSFHSNDSMLEIAREFINYARKRSTHDEYLLVYTKYDKQRWNNKVAIIEAKLNYYRLLSQQGFYGDEKVFISLFSKSDSLQLETLNVLSSLNIADNDMGEKSERTFWMGKLSALSSDRTCLYSASKSFISSLIYGAPRKAYDTDDLRYLSAIHDSLGITSELNDWIRELSGYKGIVFSDMTSKYGISDNRFTRVALGDYDNDGFTDALFNGNKLYHNVRGEHFESVDNGLADLDANGGLFADFNRDGYLDMMNISNNDLYGEQLMKNQHGERFIPVSERAGDISDRFPSEGAAWIDQSMDGYPDLYVANYEKWQQQSGFPDYFWQNLGGYFTDMSDSLGFRIPAYTHDPGQAGRGVAPADFDNDGKQEIYVTNYRLNRNFCWKETEQGYVDIAPLYAIQGKYKNGYYGHSIGADWGDYDNDGDLDLFVANLAHPRYIDISDVSILYRNDGLAKRVIDADTLYYWQFTDVTRASGIQYDELHSDPLWFDPDNDGNLDLFITSVYENDRSYLYHNNGDGTFTDITWLSGCRVYNGWGNASADINRDGLVDLIVGSGNGTKVLINRTATRNKLLTVKPIWAKGKLKLLTKVSAFSKFPNSPAFGARVEVTLKDNKGKKHTLIRELSGAKGTTSQNAQELYFGIANNKVTNIKLVKYEKH